MKGNVTAGLGVLPRALPRALFGGPLSPAVLGLGRWPLSQAHLPVCQQGALNVGELLGRMYGSETSSSKRSPRWCASALEVGNPARESPRCWQARGAVAISSGLFSHRKPQGNFQGNKSRSLVESAQPWFQKAENPSGSLANCCRSQFKSLLNACVISGLNLFCFNFH